MVEQKMRQQTDLLNSSVQTGADPDRRRSIWKTERGVDLLDLTTAWVCADVPEAMLVRAQAASNCREGLSSETKRNASERDMKPLVSIATNTNMKNYKWHTAPAIMLKTGGAFGLLIWFSNNFYVDFEFFIYYIYSFFYKKDLQKNITLMPFTSTMWQR